MQDFLKRLPRGRCGFLFAGSLLLITTGLLPNSAGAQVVRGRLIDNLTSGPVVNGTVTLLDSLGVARARVLSDSEGRFVLDAPGPGRYTIRAGGLSYRGGFPAQVELVEEGEVTADIYLEPQPLTLDPLSVSAERVRTELERQGFYERMARKRGFFLTPSHLKTRPPVTEAEVIGRAPFVEIRRSWTGSEVLIRAGGRACRPILFVDNFEVRGWASQDDVILEDHVNFADIVALEVYRGFAEVPQESAVLDNTCGVIMIWTVWSEQRSRKSGGVGSHAHRS